MISDDSNTSQYRKLLRLLRLPRFIRIAKILDIFKNIKLMKDNKIYGNLGKIFEMNKAILRMIQGLVFSIMITHIFACLWFLTAKFYDFNSDTWVSRYNVKDLNTYD